VPVPGFVPVPGWFNKVKPRPAAYPSFCYPTSM
jgi:hypothetical protein